MKYKKFISLAFLSILSLTSCGSIESNSSDSSDNVYKNDPNFEVTNNIDSSINYQIFVRSFKDSNGDGIGDIKGIISEIPYLKSLGVKNIWLTPIHKTSTNHGYDVIDYYSIATDLGTMDDFSNLVSTLKENNMGVILDMVFNHASQYNQYFIDALNDYRNENIYGQTKSDNSKSDWFNFSLKSANNYKLVDSTNNIYCESQFDTLDMMDFNLNCEEVISEMQNILRFWEEKGVAGFRYDAVKYYFGQVVRDETINVLNTFKSTCRDLYMVGESWDNDINTLSSSFKSNFDSFFYFPSSSSGGTSSIVGYTKNRNSIMVMSNIKKAMGLLETSKIDTTSSYKSCASFFLSNHDMNRVGSTYKDTYVLKLLANVNYLLPGTPYIYYGEELGMKGQRGAEQTDANRRMPMLFDEGKCNYLSGTSLTAISSQITTSVNDELKDNDSLLNHYKRLMSIRNKMGSMLKYAGVNSYIEYNAQSDKNLLTYELVDSNDSSNSYLVITNLSNSEDLSFKLNDDDYSFNNILGFLPCMSYDDGCTIIGREITLPMSSTIVIGKNKI